MPNICTATIKVKGYKDNVDEFTRILQADYDYNKMEFSHKPHFFRVFEAYIVDEEINNLIKTTTYSIDCAWSVSVCMTSGPFSYYDDLKSSFNEFYGTTLSECARNLNLFIELISEEYGMCFNEYMAYNNFGYELVNECTNMREYDLNDYESLEDFNQKENMHMDKDDYDYYMDPNSYDGWYASPNEDLEFNIVDNIKNAVNIVVVKPISKGDSNDRK